MSRRSRLAGTAMLATLLVATAACGDGSDTSSTSAPRATAAPASGVGAVAVPTLLTSQEGATLIADTPGLTVIDVRTVEEFAQGHVDGAVNVDVEGGAFEAGVADLDRNAPVLVYCRSGRRSALAAEALVQAGFTRVYDMGGLQDWEAAGLPITID